MNENQRCVADDYSGSAIYLYGNIGPQYSTAAITINGAAVESTLNFSVSLLDDVICIWMNSLTLSSPAGPLHIRSYGSKLVLIHPRIQRW